MAPIFTVNVTHQAASNISSVPRMAAEPSLKLLPSITSNERRLELQQIEEQSYQAAVKRREERKRQRLAAQIEPQSTQPHPEPVQESNINTSPIAGGVSSPASGSEIVVSIPSFRDQGDEPQVEAITAPNSTKFSPRVVGHGSDNANGVKRRVSEAFDKASRDGASNANTNYTGWTSIVRTQRTHSTEDQEVTNGSVSTAAEQNQPGASAPAATPKDPIASKGQSANRSADLEGDSGDDLYAAATPPPINIQSDDAALIVSETAVNRLTRPEQVATTHTKPTKANGDDQRQSSSKRAKIILPKPASNAASSTQAGPSSSSLPSPVPSANGAEDGSLAAILAASDSLAGARKPPMWYQELKKATNRRDTNPNADVLLRALKDSIRQVKNDQTNMTAWDKAVQLVRTQLHKIAFIPVDGRLLRNNRMLHNEDGLPSVFDNVYSNGDMWPWDIEADAEELYNRWYRGIFENDLLRGIRMVKGNLQIDPNYMERVNSHYFGNGDLLNGQWWPTRLTMLRDGAHGEAQGGICGERPHGAFSCVMSGGLDNSGQKYPDQDDGHTVLYCGTDSVDGVITEATQRMRESVVSGRPVRLIRSAKVASAYAPEKGYRYDGLYRVVNSRLLDGEGSLRQRYQFKLVRQGGQRPIRGGNIPERRPTNEELEAYEKLQTMTRGSAI